MKRLFHCVMALLLSAVAHAQLDTSITLDVLNAPASPGAVLLGISESEIQRPTDPTAFMLSLRQGTENFTQLPTNYAVDIAPGLIWGKQRSAAELAELGAPYVGAAKGKPSLFNESLVLSFAVKNLSSSAGEGGEMDTLRSVHPQLGWGFKVALKRGQVKESSKVALKKVYAAMADFNATTGHAVTVFSTAEPVDSFLAEEVAKAQIIALGGAPPSPMVVTTTFAALTPIWGAHTGYNGNLAAQGILLDGDVLKDMDDLAALQQRVLQWSDGSPGVALIRQEIVTATNTGNAAAVSRLNAVLAARAAWVERYWQYMADQRDLIAPKVRALAEQASAYKLEREGAFWDLSAGLVLDFVDRRFDNSNLTKAAVWTTYGNEGSKQVSWQVLGRYLFNPDNVFMGEADTLEMQDIHNLDLGARLSFDSENERFSFGLEFLGRTVLNDVGLDPTWRSTLNASYDLGNNRILTMSLGKNFDGTTSKSGNLIAALNLLFGLGGKKQL